MKDGFSQKIHGKIIFSVYMYKCYKYGVILLPIKAKIIFFQKNAYKGGIFGITKKRNDIHPRKYGISAEIPYWLTF